MDIAASIPARLIEIAQTNPFGLAFAVLGTVAVVMQAWSMFGRRNGS